MTEISIPDAVFEEFRCSICKRYLSTAPVQLLPDGHSICSQCSPSTESITYRQLCFETLLSKLSFPCRFKINGCEERSPFGCANKHENVCMYRSFLCPSLPSKSCAWEGSAEQIPSHFSVEHPNLLKEKLEFNLQVDQDDEGVLMVVLSGVSLIFKYIYTAGTCNLQYDIRYFKFNIEESCNIRLKLSITNALDCDYSSTLKGVCFPYNSNFYDMQHSRTLILKNYLQVLDNPNWVKVTVDATFNEPNTPVEESLDDDLRESSRCKRCRRDSTPTENELVPCQWESCELVGKLETIQKHALVCPVRTFKCAECTNTFTWDEAMAHLRGHGYKYFTDQFIYKLVFRIPYSKKKCFTFKNNEIIIVGRHTESFGRERYRHILGMIVTGNGSSEVTLKVKFGHDHCTAKSDIYSVMTSAPECFTLSQLPPCFQINEALEVTLTL